MYFAKIIPLFPIWRVAMLPPRMTHPPEFESALRREIEGEVSFDPVVLGIYATAASNYQTRK